MSERLFHDFPDLYQLLANIAAEDDASAGDEAVIGRLSPVFCKRACGDIMRLSEENGAGSLPWQEIAEAADWVHENAEETRARFAALARLTERRAAQ